MPEKLLPEESRLEDKNEEKSPQSDEPVLPEEIQTIIDDPDIPSEKKQLILKAFISITNIQHESSMFRGPLPPPELLDGYNSAVRDGAERVVAMAEKQSNHRMHLENYAVKEELKQSGRGQIFGFILGLVGLGLATILALYGHETIAGIFGTTTIGGLVAVFVLGKRAQQKDLQEKVQ